MAVGWWKLGLAVSLLSACDDPANLDDGDDSGDSDAAVPESMYPILFVTQVPWDGFASVSMPFGNHLGSADAIPRGGDLWIRYPDGTLRNLTEEAGHGSSGLQGDDAIAVREPSMHWDGNRAVFSMVVGAPEQYDYRDFYWQLYEVTGLGVEESVVITRVENQPLYNNISPVYGSDDRIIFASDRPRSGDAHLYPQLDEYESTQAVTGLWSLDPTDGDLFLLEHAPSGAFHPFIDSAGRVIFTKWDHLQRDQQGDSEEVAATYFPFDFASESENAARSRTLTEVFPEPRVATATTPYGPMYGHRFNQFLPWEVNQDGTAEETLNHVGRHELGGSYIEGSFENDENLTYLIDETLHANRNEVDGDGGMFYLREDPTTEGRFVGASVQEFAGGRAGQLIALTGGVDTNPEDMVVTFLTPVSTRVAYDDEAAPADHSGHYRNPLVLSDGTLIAAHTPHTTSNPRMGTDSNPDYPYRFRLRAMQQGSNGMYTPAGYLTDGISKSVRWFSPDIDFAYDGPLWELDPVEVRPRTRPTARVSTIAAPEQAVLDETSTDIAELRAWLVENDLALVISRNVTMRDRADVQQPFNLRVTSGVESSPADGTVYEIDRLQFFQGDQVRGYGEELDDPRRGRRVLARPMHVDDANPPNDLEGAVTLSTDGSMAAFVPARRALAWQLVDPNDVPIVRERNWVSFQAGEIRTCPTCHGLNREDHEGRTTPDNEPEALRALLTYWQTR